MKLTKNITLDPAFKYIAYICTGAGMIIGVSKPEINHQQLLEDSCVISPEQLNKKITSPILNHKGRIFNLCAYTRVTQSSENRSPGIRLFTGGTTCSGDYWGSDGIEISNNSDFIWTPTHKEADLLLKQIVTGLEFCGTDKKK